MNTPDSIAKEREKFRKHALKTLSRLGAKPTNKLGDKNEVNIVLASRVEDYDLDNNLIFEHPDNKSYPSDEKCIVCSHELVLSGAMQKMVINARVDKKKPKIAFLCNRCISGDVKKMLKKAEKEVKKL